MARPLRIQFPGALYHVTTRGDRKEDIYEDDRDRYRFLDILGETAETYNWGILAYCLMCNHYHLVVETPDANLSRGMRHLNGVYTQSSNRRHERVGHLFQGRPKAILVDAESYLLEVSRYVVLNPVRAGMVALPSQWRWSSFRYTMGVYPPPNWLLADRLLAHFAERRDEARARYRDFVHAGIDQTDLWQNLRQQIYLGDDSFVERMLALSPDASHDLDIPRLQARSPAPSLATIAARHPERDHAVVSAYATGHYSYRQIGDFFGIHFSTVGYIVRNAKRRDSKL